MDPLTYWRHAPRWLAAPVLLAAATIAGGANAQSPSPETVSMGWDFQIAPYLWGAGLEGDMATLPNLPTISVDQSFSDILEDTEIGLMVLGEARRGDWAISLDVVYESLSSEASTPGPLFSDAELDSTTLIVTPALSYRAYEDRAASLDVGVGGRFWYLDNELDFSAGLLPAVSSSESESWVDPIILIKGRLDLGSNFYLAGYGDIGGAGVASDLTWQLMGLLGYRFNDWIDGAVGYRHLSVDYEDDGFVWDVEMSGPILGVTFRF